MSEFIKAFLILHTWLRRHDIRDARIEVHFADWCGRDRASDALLDEMEPHTVLLDIPKSRYEGKIAGIPFKLV